MPKENYLRTSGKTVIVKLTPFLNLALDRCNSLALITFPFTPTEKSPLYHVVLEPLDPRLSTIIYPVFRRVRVAESGY